jgi:hypothetical protein
MNAKKAFNILYTWFFNSKLPGNMKKTTLLLALLCAPLCAGAQCAMCRAVLETSEGNAAQGINNGILYLMVIPYLLVFVIGYFVYRKMRK